MITLTDTCPACLTPRRLLLRLPTWWGRVRHRRRPTLWMTCPRCGFDAEVAVRILTPWATPPQTPSAQ